MPTRGIEATRRHTGVTRLGYNERRDKAVQKRGNRLVSRSVARNVFEMFVC